MKLISKNPSRNYEVLGKVSVSSEAEIKHAVSIAKEAIPIWSNLSLDTRCNHIQSFINISKK